MNKTQKNIKKQIAKSLYYEEKKAKKGKGVFSNNLFSQRFYGYNNSCDYTYKPLIIQFLSFIFRLIFFIIKIAFLFAILLLIITLVYVIKSNVHDSNMF